MLPKKCIDDIDNSIAIRAKNLRKYYLCHGRDIIAIDGIDLTIHTGEHICIVGKSGSGKSTLTRIICGIETPSSGTVELFGNDPRCLLHCSRIEYSKTIQLIRQESYLTFDPMYTIQDSLLRTVTLHKKMFKKTQTRLQYICSIMENYGMQDLFDLFSRRPKELSGGQLQRFAFLRTLLVSPKILIADEPTAMLDESTTKKMAFAFEQLPNDITFIYITHNDYLSSIASNRIIAIQNGKIM